MVFGGWLFPKTNVGILMGKTCARLHVELFSYSYDDVYKQKFSN